MFVGSKFEDPRAADRRKHELALYASTAARYDDQTLEQAARNRSRCENGGEGGRVLGHFLYEATGVDNGATRKRGARATGVAKENGRAGVGLPREQVVLIP
jgi:hypothetical protein